MLSSLYSYGTIAYVGGGMGTKGLHNILEPAYFSKPIIIGKNYRGFDEAEKMIENGIKKILNALELFIKKLPNYKKPEILENGDIIIRRIKPSQSDPPRNIKKRSGKQDTGI